MHSAYTPSSNSDNIMCVSQEFTAANIADKVWAIPRAKQYLATAQSAPTSHASKAASRNLLVTKASCCNGASKPTRKNSLTFVLNDDDDRRQIAANADTCLVQITVLDDADLFECIFTCHEVNRYAKLTFDTQQFVLGSDGRRNNYDGFLLAKHSLVRISFGRIVSPGAAPSPPPARQPHVSHSAHVPIPQPHVPQSQSQSPPPPSPNWKAQRIAPAPIAPMKPMTSEERNDAARRDKEQRRKIRKREAAAKSNKRRSEAKRKKGKAGNK